MAAISTQPRQPETGGSRDRAHQTAVLGFLVAGGSGVIYPPFGTERKVDVDTGIEV